MSTPRVTVYTGTYNRAHTLWRAYESLENQTYDDFEWLVIDDHSSDGTEELIRQLQDEAEFPIRLLEQETRGRHIGYNMAFREAKGQFIAPLDSDDQFLPRGLETLVDTWEEITPGERGDFVGVAGHSINEHGEVHGDPLPEEVIDGTKLELQHDYGILGEKGVIFRTDVMREYMFPELTGVRYIPESYIWNRISMNYKYRYISTPVRVYLEDDPLQEQGSTTRLSYYGRPLDMAPAYRLKYQTILNTQLKYFRQNPRHLTDAAASYNRYSVYSRVGIGRWFRELDSNGARTLCVLSAPLSLVQAVKDIGRQFLSDELKAKLRPYVP